MKNPDSGLFQHWTELQRTGRMVGFDRPISRVFWSKRLESATTSNRPGPWRHVLFSPSDPIPEYELQQVIKSVEISRSIGQDAATCKIEMYNFTGTSLDPTLSGDESPDSYGNEGFFTFNRGHSTTIPVTSVFDGGGGQAGQFNSHIDLGGPEGTNPNDPYPIDWAYTQNLYKDALIPNTVIRVYQGYGSDNLDEYGNLRRSLGDPDYVSGADDSKMVLRGVFLIDTVTYMADGTIEIDCRDLAKLLLDQYVYPPALPIDRFPLIYCPGTASTGAAGTVGKNVAKYSANSVEPYYGYNAPMYGHVGTDAFDSRADSYWLSIGNALPSADYSYEWIEASCGGTDVNQVLFSTKGASYTVYIAVMESNTWQGDPTVPYNPSSPAAHPNGSDIHYVMKVTSGSDGQTNKITLPRTYKAQKIRLIFTDLWNSGLGVYPYRAAVREMTARYVVADTYQAGTINKPGFITDWSEAVKELCGWGGLTWYDSSPVPADVLLGNSKNTNKPLRIWGDFEILGAGPVVCTPGDFFMNKSFMDAIRSIADFLGCIFYIDETGGAIFRLPNVFGGGNFVDDPTHAIAGVNDIDGAYMRRRWPIEFHENANLISYQVTLDDSQVRSEVLVIGEYPNVTHSNYIAGGATLNQSTSAINFNNVLAGQQRIFIVPGDNTVLFNTQLECQRMAEMIGLFIMFSYRSGQLVAPFHPGLQLDDQVRIFERVTVENHVHYVSGIDDTFDYETGQWTMNVTTHWLGEDPDAQWFVNNVALTPAVANLPAIIKRVGSEAGDSTVGLGGPVDTVGNAPLGS